LDYVKKDCDLDDCHAAPRDQLKSQVDKPNQECCPAAREDKQSHYNAGGKKCSDMAKPKAKKEWKHGELFLVIFLPAFDGGSPPKSIRC
jgi:hypothetical protein